MTVRTQDALAIYTGCWSSPPISYECAFLWIGVTLVLLRLWVKLNPHVRYTSKRITSSMEYVAMNDNDSITIDLICLQQRKQMFHWPSRADILYVKC